MSNVYFQISLLSFKILFSEADSKCSGKLSWIDHKQTMNVTQTVTLNLSRSLVYLLAVSANLPSVSSGMVWSQCTVKQVHISLNVLWSEPGVVFTCTSPSRVPCMWWTQCVELYTEGKCKNNGKYLVRLCDLVASVVLILAQV